MNLSATNGSPSADHRRRTLHLIDQASSRATPTTLALIARFDQSLLLLGGEAMQHAADAAGCPDATRLSAPAGHAFWGMATLARGLVELGQPRDLHAWSLSCLAALRWVGGPAQHTLHLAAPLTRTETRQLRRLDNPTLRIVVYAESLREQLIAIGVDAARIVLESLDGHENLQPPIAAADQRQALRQQWEVPDECPVVALLSDPPTAADTFSAIMTINLTIEAAGRDIRLLVHPEQSQRQRTQTALDEYGQPNRLIQDAAVATPWAILPACDAVLLGQAPAPLSARYALAAGLPIVAADTPDHREALGDGPNVHYAVSAEPKRLADRLQHRALQWPAVPLPPVGV